MRINLKAVFLLLMICFQILLGQLVFAYDTVKLKMTVANPSGTETKTMPVKINLPLGVMPEDVVNRGNFKIDYDIYQSQYYAYQDVTLDPNQTISLELEMKDIWVVPLDEINALKTHIQQDTDALNKTAYNQQAKVLGDSIVKRLDQIVDSQKNLQGLDPQERISNFDTNSDLLKEIKKDISVLDDLLIEVNPSATSLFKVDSKSQTEIPKLVLTASGIDKIGLISFEIDAVNPSDSQATVPLKYYLPSEVKPQDIVDKAGLKVGYDYQKDEHYIYNDGVLLRPSESKKFVVTVKDVWAIPAKQIDILKEHTNKLLEFLAQTEYKSMAQSLTENILAGLNDILNSQEDKNVTVQMHIGNYRKNLKKLEDIRGDIAGLDNLFTQAGGSIGDMLKNNGSLPGARGAELISKSIFRGKAPDVATSWNIIWTIVGFLGIMSFLFFILWWGQVRAEGSKKLEKII